MNKLFQALFIPFLIGSAGLIYGEGPDQTLKNAEKIFQPQQKNNKGSIRKQYFPRYLSKERKPYLVYSQEWADYLEDRFSHLKQIYANDTKIRIVEIAEQICRFDARKGNGVLRPTPACVEARFWPLLIDKEGFAHELHLCRSDLTFLFNNSDHCKRLGLFESMRRIQKQQKELYSSRLMPDEMIANDMHSLIDQSNKISDLADSNVDLIEMVVKSRKSSLIQQNATTVLVNFMRFVRPKSADKDSPDYSPALRAISLLNLLREQNPHDQWIGDTINRTMAQTLANDPDLKKALEVKN